MVNSGKFEFLKKPTKSESDKKIYDFFKLPNGLKVLQVQEPKVVRKIDEGNVTGNNSSAVALCVSVGSFDDPQELQGLAHFLEHMVFLGSRRFSRENEFDNFIKSRNGIVNAFTDCEYTIFYFKIGNEFLDSALDRFSQLFISPLMTREGIEREIKAVDSEFQNDKNCDSCRVLQLITSMVRPDHPISNFSWGNSNSLHMDIDLMYNIVHKFHEKFYKADRMFLAVQSTLSFPIVQTMVTRYFGEIKSEIGTSPELYSYTIDPFKDVFQPKFHQKMFFVKSASKKRKIIFTFLIPTRDHVGRFKFLDYLVYLFNSDCQKSLISYLKRNSLAVSLDARIGMRDFEDNSLFALFTIEVNLTRFGFDQMDRVIDAIFGYLLIIKMTPMEEHREMYKNFKIIQESLNNRKMERNSEENVQILALNMRFSYDDQNVVLSRNHCPQFDEIIMRKLVESLNELKFNLIVLSDSNQNFDRIERWFGTEYSEIDFPRKYIRMWNERWIREEFVLPSKNKFACKNFEIFNKKSSEVNFPRIIYKTDNCDVFFMPDENFLLPFGFIGMQLRSCQVEDSTRNVNVQSIYSMMVKDFLSQDLSMARAAGYSFDLHSCDDGMIMKLSGFSGNILTIFDIIVKSIFDFNNIFDVVRFENFKKHLKKNCYSQVTNSQTFIEDLRLCVIDGNHKSYLDRFKEIDSIDYQDAKIFIMNFLRNLRVKILIEGNFNECQANEVAKKIAQLSESSKIRNDNKRHIRDIRKGMNCLRTRSMLSSDGNSLIKNYYQIGVNSVENVCLLEILAKIIKEPLYSAIRTTQQIGYSVSCQIRNDLHMLGFEINVKFQEKKFSPDEVNQKLDEFLLNFPKQLEKMAKDEFNVIKNSIKSGKFHYLSKMELEIESNWKEIVNDEFNYERHIIEARQIDLIQKNEILDFFNLHFSTENCRKLSIQIVSQKDPNYESLIQHGFLHLDILPCENNVENLYRTPRTNKVRK